ncbi:hypothetical protein ABZ642_34860 [Streptomyces sp. NPDC007157]|uniref:hypothetical protein n=1 Tax=Streptomyces sp. NPDC007157 TaxID=3154681 RepID=UPI0033FDB7AC
MPTERQRHVRGRDRGVVLVLTAVVAALTLTACTKHDRQDSPVVAGAEDKPSPTKPSPTPSFTPPSTATLPTHAIPADEMPRLGEATAMAKGYTGKTFLDDLSKAWGITLGDPKEEEFPGGRKKTVITGDNGKGLSLLLTVTKADELVLLDCIAENGDAHTTAFLRACAAVDAPGADPNRATTWFDQAKKETDTLYAKKKEATVSGILTTGKLVMFVNRLTDSEQLKIFGGGTADNS